jgi:hypothetical protein
MDVSMAARKSRSTAAAAAAQAIEPADPATIYVEQIKAAWRESVFGVIETGEVVVKAKKDLGYGNWVRLFEKDDEGKRRVPFGLSTAERLMDIAADARIRRNAPILPTSWYSLYLLTRLTDQDFDYLLRVGTIAPELTREGLFEAVRQLQGADRDEDGEPIFKSLPGPTKPKKLPPPHHPGRRGRPLLPGEDDDDPLAADERRELMIELATLMQTNMRRAGGGLGFIRGEGAKRIEEILRQLNRPVEDAGADDDPEPDGDSDEWWTPEHILGRVRMVFPIP